MKNSNFQIHKNLSFLRKLKGLSIESVADAIGVSRQAVSKWESGETIPDLLNCEALSRLYDVSIDELLHYDGEDKVGISPKGKHMFGIAVVGERGQLVIPKNAREIMKIKPGDRMVVLGDEEQGLALVRAEEFLTQAQSIMEKFYPKE